MLHTTNFTSVPNRYIAIHKPFMNTMNAKKYCYSLYYYCYCCSKLVSHDYCAIIFTAVTATVATLKKSL